MARHKVQKVVIAGGGTAGWVAAAAISKQLGHLVDIILVESDDIGTIGVGEASIPPMRTFHRLAGVDERSFMRETQATFKLGIQFENWRQLGDSYIHAFGEVGKNTWLADFHHIWLEARTHGLAEPLDSYCPETQAALAHKFALSENGGLNYAYHLDAGRYAQYLRGLCETRGVTRVEGKITQVQQSPDTGFIESLLLESGETLNGDLFVDCTGFRGLLIEQCLKTGYEDWTHWLPTDRALAVQTSSEQPAPPYTRAIARDSGWQWQIPLQQRVGNGLVYCSQFQSEEAAQEQLLDNLPGKPLTEPKLIRYQTGRRKKMWHKNCVALGLASGFVEPLESTSIYLVMIGITRLLQLFPFDGITESAIRHYNETARVELEGIRDFIILHYKLTERTDTGFWRHCRDQAVPDSLAHRIDLYRDAGQIKPGELDLFRLASWLQVMHGQGLEPQGHHHFARLMTTEQLSGSLNSLRESIARSVEKLPNHQDFIKRYCAS